MTDRIDPSMESMQSPRPHPPTDAVLVDPDLRELG